MPAIRPLKYSSTKFRRSAHIKIGLYPDSQLNIKPTKQFDALVSGQLAMTVYPLEYAEPMVPEFAIATFPFIPADLKMAMRLKGTPFQARYNASPRPAASIS